MTAEKAKEAAKRYAGTGVIGAILMFMIPYVDGRIGAVENEIHRRQVNMTDYVDKRHGEVKDRLDLLQHTLDKIDRRLYDILKNK